MGQFDVETGTLGLDAITDGEIVGIVDLGTLRVGIDHQKVQLALVNPLAGAAGLVLQPFGNLEDPLLGLFLDAQAWDPRSVPGIPWPEDTPASCAISFNVAMQYSRWRCITC
jgi:hypothetical protein